MDTRDIDFIGLSFGQAGVAMSDQNKDEYSRIFGHAKDWYGNLSESDAKTLHPRILEKSCRSYVTAKVKPAGFLPGIVWWFAGKLIMSYIINRILEYIKSKRA